jgi:hypothetical protein
VRQQVRVFEEGRLLVHRRSMIWQCILTFSISSKLCLSPRDNSTPSRAPFSARMTRFSAIVNDFPLCRDAASSVHRPSSSM